MSSPESAGRSLQGAPRGVSARESGADGRIVGDVAQEFQPDDSSDAKRVAFKFDLSLVCEPLLVDAIRAGGLCDLCERSWRKLDRTARVPRPVRVGRRKLWVVAELRAWVAAGCPSRERWETMSRGTP